jgi:putative FmdB family regulatory protein
MPLYEYECKNCGEDIERYEHHINLMSPPQCLCGSTMKKKMSSSSFQFFGDGVYATSKHGNQRHNRWGRGRDSHGTLNKMDSLGKEYSKYPDITKD